MECVSGSVCVRTAVRPAGSPDTQLQTDGCVHSHGAFDERPPSQTRNALMTYFLEGEQMRRGRKQRGVEGNRMAAGFPKHLPVVSRPRRVGPGPTRLPPFSRERHGLPSAQRSRRWPKALRVEREGSGTATLAPTSSTAQLPELLPQAMMEGGWGWRPATGPTRGPTVRPLFRDRLASSHRLAAAWWGATRTAPETNAREPRSGVRAWSSPAALLQSPRRQGAWVLGSHRLRRGFQEQREALGQLTASRVTFRHRSPPGRRPGVTAEHPAGTWSPGASCTDNNRGAAKKAMP